MIKNNRGITVMTLTVTIVLLMIITGIGTTTVYTAINDYRDNRLSIELGMVRQVVVEQYQKAKAVNQLNVKPSENKKVAFWVGDRLELENVQDIELPEGEKLQNFENYAPEYLEDYYYRLTPKSLDNLGISDSKYTYIVNYSTGEVYNETKKRNSQKELLYLPAFNNTNQENTKDLTSFNDWK